jgi:hypothetical protein
LDLVNAVTAKDPNAKILIHSDHGPHNFGLVMSNGKPYENGIFFMSNLEKITNEIAVGKMLQLAMDSLIGETNE